MNHAVQHDILLNTLGNFLWRWHAAFHSQIIWLFSRVGVTFLSRERTYSQKNTYLVNSQLLDDKYMYAYAVGLILKILSSRLYSARLPGTFMLTSAAQGSFAVKNSLPSFLTTQSSLLPYHTVLTPALPHSTHSCLTTQYSLLPYRIILTPLSITTQYSLLPYHTVLTPLSITTRYSFLPYHTVLLSPLPHSLRSFFTTKSDSFITVQSSNFLCHPVLTPSWSLGSHSSPAK